MKNKLLYYLFSASISFLILLSCNPSRRIQEDKFILSENHITSKSREIQEGDLKKIIKQKPNRKIVGKIPLRLYVSNLVNPEKVETEKASHQVKINKRNLKREAKGKKPKENALPSIKYIYHGLINEIGEKPVILDTLLTLKSSKQLELYLFKKGFFNASVSDSTIYKNRKALVHYIVTENQAYKVKEISYSIKDSSIAKIVEKEKINSLIKSNENYDEDKLIDERERITKILKNHGYYAFLKEYINFDLDSSLKSHQLNIEIEINNPEKNTLGKPDSTLGKHSLFKIQEIFIVPSYNQFNSTELFNDTLNYDGYKFIYNNTIGFRPSTIVENLKIKPNILFVSDNLDATYKNLNDLKVFKLVNIFLEESKNSSEQANDTLPLTCYIRLTPSVKQSYGIDLEGTTSPSVNIGLGRNLGIEGNIVYFNKNIFKGAEIFEARLKGKLEAQQTIANEAQTTFFFNTKEIGPELSLHIPKLFLPKFASTYFKKIAPNANRTSFLASYNYQERPDFKRRIATLSYGFFGKTRTRQIFLYIPEINLVNVEIFNKEFIKNSRPIVLASFIPHITIGPRLVFLYNNQNMKKESNFLFFRCSTEESGIVLRKVYDLRKVSKNSDDIYELVKGTPFSEYFKIDTDFRYYNLLNNRNRIVYRIASGLGKPLKNSNALPIEKSYFAGGSNNIRAWPARTLGPGSFDDTSNTNTLRIGDINLEANIEYRYNIIKAVNGALFLDAGNIWLYKHDPERPNGNFEINKFYSQMALGTGIGLRIDFSFFVFRFDVGLKLRDPMLAVDNEQWVIKNIFNSTWKDDYKKSHPSNYKFQSFNFGIGYPF